VRVRTLTPVLCLIVVGILALGACGGSTSKGSSSASSPSSSAAAGGTVSTSAFCSSMSNFINSFKTAFSDSTLADTKRDFPKVVSTAQALNPAPANLRTSVSNTNADLVRINAWVQTQATQKDLNGNSVPSVIKGPFSDLQTQTKTLSSYATGTCGIKGSSGSSGAGSSGSGSTSRNSGAGASGNT
jgi:hypothetical protein